MMLGVDWDCSVPGTKSLYKDVFTGSSWNFLLNATLTLCCSSSMDCQQNCYQVTIRFKSQSNSLRPLSQCILVDCQQHGAWLTKKSSKKSGWPFCRFCATNCFGWSKIFHKAWNNRRRSRCQNWQSSLNQDVNIWQVK